MMKWSQAEREARIKLKHTEKRGDTVKAGMKSSPQERVLEPRCFLKVNKQKAAIPTPAFFLSSANILELTDTSTKKLTEVIKMNKLWSN